MAGGLRRDGGPYGAEGAYYATGTLKGITGPGRRTVRSLALRRLGPAEDLSVLGSFDALKKLELEHVDGVDLRPLAGLELEQLTITQSSGFDLAPVVHLPQLVSLVLGNLRDITAPTLTLAPSLRVLAIINDDLGLTGKPVRQLIEAIDWSRLADLRTLSLRVGGLHDMPTVAVDLDFLRMLPHLERLDMYKGLRHRGTSPSPTEPPFDGLSRQLTFARIDSDNPTAVRAALCAYLGVDPTDEESSLVVYQRVDIRDPDLEWTISGPIDHVWSSYGSLQRAERGTADDTEYDACERARDHLRTADAALLKRLDFDPESAGTGIYAPSRDDLAAALAILKLRT